MSPTNTSQNSEVPDVTSLPRPDTLDRSAVTSTRQERPGGSAGPEPMLEAPSQSAVKKWKVRLHWGIIFAVVSSLALWLFIRELISLAF
jgi:hypothetical protein